MMFALPQEDVGVHSEQQQEEDVALQNLSRMLMEEEEDGRLSCQYHPALLHVQLSFAHLISSSSSSSDGETNNLVINTEADQADTTFSERRPRKNLHGRRDELEEGAGRARKVTATAGPQEESQEMIDRMMLSDCEISSEEMADLRAAVEADTKKARRPRQQEVLVDLRTLLLHCARKVADGRGGARELLEQIKRHASPDGDATQRLASCFAEALEARLAGTTTLRASSRSLVTRSSSAEFLGAYRLFMATFCFKKVAFTFANRTICRAAAGRSRLHIVDYGLGLGFQWPSLLRRLAARDGGPPAVTLTGVDLPEPGFRPAAHIEETGRRLGTCARALGVPFQFRAVASATWADAVRAEDLTTTTDHPDDVALVVNSLFSLEALLDDSVVVDSPSARDVLLGRVRRMRPAVFTHGVVNGCYGTSFMMRFREALFNYSAVFDALGATMPSGSEQRRVLERDCLGPCVLNAVACEGRDRTDRFDTYRQWQLRMRRAGLRQLPLDRAVVGAVREMVKRQQYHKDFVVDEDQRWLLQGPPSCMPTRAGLRMTTLSSFSLKKQKYPFQILVLYHSCMVPPSNIA